MTRGKPLRCLYAASEVAGFAKTGGLADVAGALPRALADRGVDCAVIMPLYHCIRRAGIPLAKTDFQFDIPIGHRVYSGSLWRATLPDSPVPVFLVDQPEFFDRDDPAEGRGLSQYTQKAGRKTDYHDN